MPPVSRPVPGSALECRPLRWWSDADLRIMAERVGVVWQRWATDWECPAIHPVAFNACQASAGWHPEPINWSPPAAESRKPALWLGASRELVPDLLQRVLFGATVADVNAVGSLTVAQELAQRAHVELEQRLQSSWAQGVVDASGSPDTQALAVPPAVQSRRWSGAVRIQLSLATTENDSLWLHLPLALAAQCVPSGGNSANSARKLTHPLVSVSDAMQRETLRVRVGLSPVVIGLGSLLDLRVGDVIKTPHRLDAPLTVALLPGEGREARPLCLGHLGVRALDKALALIPLNSPTEPFPAVNPGNRP